MSFEHYIEVGKKRLRCGYTTGTCAAAAAQACGHALLAGDFPCCVRIETPAGITVEVEPEGVRRGIDAEGAAWASCGVRKDAGDDSDATDGALVCACVRLAATPGVAIGAGPGVGRVTRPGLDQPVGAAAINSTPRAMIAAELERLAAKHGWRGGFDVEIFVAGGEEIARKTFNPRLGIEGGISILGTSGIVRPMSEDALVESIRLEMRVKREGGLRDLVLVPGNYGADWAQQKERVDPTHIVSCSNYLGAALDCAATLGFETLVLVGHMGKLAKVAAGAMNTHSRVADGRAEAFTAHAALAGADHETLTRLMACGTTDEALEVLAGHAAGEAPVSDAREELLAHTLAGLTEAITRHVRRRGDPVRCEVVVFSKTWGELGRSRGADSLLELHRAHAARPAGDMGREPTAGEAAQGQADKLNKMEAHQA